jgi:hypothetical protein
MSWVSDRTGVDVDLNSGTVKVNGPGKKERDALNAFTGSLNNALGGNRLRDGLSNITGGIDFAKDPLGGLSLLWTNLVGEGKHENTLNDPMAAINQLISEADAKKKKDLEDAANTASILQRQMMSAFALEKSGSFAYQRGGTILTSPLGLQDPIATGKVKQSAVGA